MKKLAALFLGLAFVCPVFAEPQELAQPQEEAKPGLYLILDGSESMNWAISEFDKRIRIEEARKALRNFILQPPPHYELALRYYRGCDTPKKADVGFLPPLDAVPRIISAAKGTPRGLTPMRFSLGRAIADFKDKPGEIILITDGFETCDQHDHLSPCRFIGGRSTEEKLRIRIHVIGLALADAERDAVRCIAKEAGTELREVATAAELLRNLQEIRDGLPKPAAKASIVPLADEQKPTEPGVVARHTNSAGVAFFSLLHCTLILAVGIGIAQRRKVAVLILILILCVIIVVTVAWSDKLLPNAALLGIALAGAFLIFAIRSWIGLFAGIAFIALQLSLLITAYVAVFAQRDDASLQPSLAWLYLAAIAVLVVVLAGYLQIAALAEFGLGIFALLLLGFGYPHFEIWRLPGGEAVLCLAALSVVWLALIWAFGSPAWLATARLRGFLLVGVIALVVEILRGLVLKTANVPSDAESSTAGGWLAGGTVGLLLIILIVFLFWAYANLRDLEIWHIFAGIVWLLVAGYFVLVEVFEKGEQWAWPLLFCLIVLVILQIRFEVYLELGDPGWPLRQIDWSLRWSVVILAFVVMIAVFLTGAFGAHLWFLAAFLLGRLYWDGFRKHSSFQTAVFLLLLVVLLIAFPIGGLPALWPGLNLASWWGVLMIVASFVFLLIAAGVVTLLLSAVFGSRVRVYYDYPGSSRKAMKLKRDFPRGSNFRTDTSAGRFSELSTVPAVEVVAPAKATEPVSAMPEVPVVIPAPRDVQVDSKPHERSWTYPDSKRSEEDWPSGSKSVQEEPRSEREPAVAPGGTSKLQEAPLVSQSVVELPVEAKPEDLVGGYRVRPVPGVKTREFVKSRCRYVLRETDARRVNPRGRVARLRIVPRAKVSSRVRVAKIARKPRWFVRIRYDEKILACFSHEMLAAQFRLQLAIRLVEIYRLTVDNAVKVAGIPKATFLKELERFDWYRHRL